MLKAYINKEIENLRKGIVATPDYDYLAGFALSNQGSNDIEYLKTITSDNVFKEIKVIPSSLSYLDNFLKVYRNNLNYIGTRLHAGIYCMDKGIRTHIVGVDQRARNIASEVGLPFIERSKIEKLDNLISSVYNINCSLPNDKISEWKNQFS